jgi:hypothetical protein
MITYRLQNNKKKAMKWHLSQGAMERTRINIGDETENNDKNFITIITNIGKIGASVQLPVKIQNNK